MKEETKIMDQFGNFNLSEYYKELESIPSKNRLPLFSRFILHCFASLSKQNRTYMQKYHFYFVLTELFNPFNNTIGRISEYRNIGGCWDRMIDVQEGFDDASIYITVTEVYDMLKSLPLNNVSYLFQKTEISQLDYEKLLDSFTTNNKNAFTEIICRNEYAINILKRFYYNYKFKYQFVKGRKHCSNKSRKRLREAFDELHLDQGESKEIKNFIEYGREMAVAPTKAPLPPLLEILKTFEQRLLSYLYYKDEFNLTEQNIIEKIVKQPKYINRYNRIYSKYLKMKQTESIPDNKKNASPNKEFTLPDNYFELECNLDDRVSVDAFCPLIKTLGVGTFKEFINDIAQEGYIDNDIITKESFAYRLTGICKPENLLEQIEWKKEKDPNSHCLFCIVKYFYQGNGRKGPKHPTLPQGRYERMQIFFNCKSSSNYSEDAKRITPKFENQLNSWYPGITPNLTENENK